MKSFGRLWFVFIASFLLVSSAFAQIDSTLLRPVAYHPSGIAYYNVPYFADAFTNGGEWLRFTGSEFGTSVDIHTAQFDENGFPKLLNSGEKLRAILFGLNIQNPFRPSTWPSHETLVKGRVVVTWKGTGDLRLVGGTFVPESSSGAATGSLTNGRRTYLTTGVGQSVQSLEIHAIDAPLTEIHVWLPAVDDPATPQKENETTSLEGQHFHPLLLQRLADTDWGYIRFMDWGSTNASPQQDWIDRRLPAHAFKNGILNRRSPGGGSPGDRETGVPFEEMIALCNQSGRNLWINVPHLATDDFITKLAQLIRFGSDGRNPYTSTQSSPTFPPLRADLKVFIEYSNEIWSSGFSFPQGDWAEAEATSHGLTKAQFNARRFCDTWRLFQNVFGGSERLVRVAAVFTGLESYTRPFLAEVGRYGTTLTPAVRPDVMAVTTYFGNAMQDYVAQKHFGEGKLFDDPYWTGAQYASDRHTAFDEWTRRLLSGDVAQGGGFDTTGVGGGFALSLKGLPREILGYDLPIVAYEGGPSLYTDAIDGGAANGNGVPTDDFVTTFLEGMNRDPEMARVYDIHLNLAKGKGLSTHTPFTDAGIWSKFGQWGHLETFDQKPSEAAKYATVLAHAQEFSSIRSVDKPFGAIPQFVQAEILPVGIVGQAYSGDITTSGGDGTRSVKLVGAYLDGGLSATVNGDRVHVAGTPSISRKNYLYLRVKDADGDPVWRIFTLESFGGPGTLVQSDFRGTSPALHAPWKPTYVLSSKLDWSGWKIGVAANGGRGVTPAEGDNAFTFSVAAPQADESVAQAFADDEYLSVTVTPKGTPLDLRGAEIRFLTRRIDFHAPRGYALTSTLTGHTEAGALYVSAAVGKDDMTEREHVLQLPSTAAFSAISAPLEFRIYAYGAEFDGHRTSLTGFKLTQGTGGRRRPVRR